MKTKQTKFVSLDKEQGKQYKAGYNFGYVEGKLQAQKDILEIIDDKIEFCNKDGSTKKDVYSIYRKLVKEIQALNKQEETK